MKKYQVEYELQDGYIHDWLVAGPQAIEVEDLDQFQGADFKLQIARHYYTSESGVTVEIVERKPVSEELPDLKWNFCHCLADHFVDQTSFYHTTHYLRSWAFATVLANGEQTLECELTTNGPADIWINDEHVHRQEHFYHQDPNRVTFTATFKDGKNDILIRFEEVAARECPYVMALQIRGLEHPIRPVRIPTPNEAIGRRLMLEQILDKCYFDRDVFVSGEDVEILFGEDMGISSKIGIRIQRPDGRIYAEAHPAAISGKSQKMVKAYELPESEFELWLMAPPEEYYEKGLRVLRKRNIYSFRNKFSEEAYGTYATRRIEALKASAFREKNLYAEVAKMELGVWKNLHPEVLEASIERINDRGDCSDFDLVGLLGMVYRYFAHPSFPEELKGKIKESALNFRYWDEEPGSDAMCFRTENHSILFHTCEILAGQLYPDENFSNVNQNGAWHRTLGEERAMAWLQQRARYGFSEWDSNVYFEEDILALSHLVDLAENEEVAEMAAVVLDKLFFTLALNSYKGAFGSTHGRSYTPYIKGSRREGTSGVSRLLWGMGCFNENMRGFVSLCATKNYEFSDLIYAIAVDDVDVWSRETQNVDSGDPTEIAGLKGVHKVLYKTADYMLASAQDYYSGEKGFQQHIWQATMGPDAVVFVTHPTCVSEKGSHRPNYWHGNYILPRTAQYKDVLVSVHKFDENDWMGYTHAYFPEYAFDEHAIRDGWAFAKKNDGYLAITAKNGLEETTLGQNAYRELCSHGNENIWLVQMGRASEDGTFEEFQEKVLGAEITYDGLSVNYTGLRDQPVSFGWEGPFMVAGEEQPLRFEKHCDSIYCQYKAGDDVMELRFLDWALRLDFSN